MKTTLELPEDLVRAVKLRALRDGRKLKDAFADLLRQGLAAASTLPGSRTRPKVSTDAKTGLPLIKSARVAPIAKMSSEEIYAMIHKTQEEEDLERLGISLRR